jgi:hypothetical protein
MLTLKFLRDILSGHKRLLWKEMIRGTARIPRFPEINVKALWEEMRNIEVINVYFPDSCVR